MSYVLIDHGVADFADWKTEFDDHEETRVAAGQQGYQLLQGSEDPNHVCILIEFDSADDARAFVDSEDLRDRMMEAGVKGEPDITFLDEVERKQARPVK